MFKKVVLVIMVILCLMGLFACRSTTTSIGGAPEPIHPVLSQDSKVESVEVGNMVYIPINRLGLPEVNIEVIFTVIQSWQEKHPDRQILDVDYVWMQNTSNVNTSNYTYGVTILWEDKK